MMNIEVRNEEALCPYCGRPNSKHYKYQKCARAARLIAKDNLLGTQEGRNAWYKIEVSVVMEGLKKYWAIHCNTVRSQFKKSFVPSVLEFYDQKGYVSKKQLQFAKDIATNPGCYQSDDDYQRECWIDSEIYCQRKALIDEAVKNIPVDPAIYQEKYKLANWYYDNGKLM